MGHKMKNPIRDLLIIFIFVNLAWLCVSPARAATVTYSGAASASNPYGYSGQATGTAVAVRAPITIEASPAPFGSPVSAGLQASAMALAGGGALAPSGTLDAVLANPSAAISAASSFMQAGGLAATLFNPAIGVPLMAAGVMLQGGLAACNVVGCSFLDGLKTQGITLNSDGSVTQTTQNSPSGAPVSISTQGNWFDNAWAGHTAETYPTPTAGCEARWKASYPDVTGVFMGTTSGGFYAYCLRSSGTIYLGQVKTLGSLTCPANSTLSGSLCACNTGYESASNGLSCVAAPPSSTTAAATSAQLTAAITAASASAAFQSDMTNLALTSGMAMVAGAVTSQSLTVASAFTQLSSVTDSLGNVVQTLSRNVSKVSTPASSMDAPGIEKTVETVTVTNGIPTAVTSTVVSSENNTATVTQCDEFPDSLGCADISKLNDLPAVTPLTSEKNISSITPVSLGVGAAVCPSPIVLPGMFGGPQMSLDIWGYPCQFAGYIKPINIAVAGMVSIFILMGAFRGSNG